ncbi:TetR/AcrR family transcriptional regulator [Virgibacillus ndiopensis]|uniref:TetR/AcrR family transcriptional regulator n=1 Tax=Virgibacillus ndiopensis TaxID=2004408 RepID=UPI000C06CD20|nr:TetR/AcrR family transcriptional regulator [Virgibacillus ndiopensis]
MNNKKQDTDPRILRTRQLIRDAFVELLQERDVEKISVNRLAERATINRVTFYLHYRDIPDMLEKMADNMIEDISIVLDQSTESQRSDEETNWRSMENVLKYIAENANFYKTILSSRRVPIFRDRLLMLLTDKIVSALENKGSESNIIKAGIKKDVLIWYDSAALIGTIVAWLQNDMPYTPSFLAKQFSLLHHRV